MLLLAALTAPLPYGGNSHKGEKKDTETDEAPRKALFDLPNTPANLANTAKAPKATGRKTANKRSTAEASVEKENKDQVSGKVPNYVLDLHFIYSICY